jgi:hypothetical protein
MLLQGLQQFIEGRNRFADGLDFLPHLQLAVEIRDHIPAVVPDETGAGAPGNLPDVQGTKN